MSRGVKRFFIAKEELARELQAKTYSQVGQEHGVNHGSVRWCAQKYGIAKPSRFWSEEEIKCLHESYYGGKRSVRSNRSLSGVYHKASRLGVKKQSWERKYSLNEGFFRVWTPEMAYFLGWLCSDGNVGYERKHIGFHIHSRDSYILERMRVEMEYGGRVFHRGQHSELKLHSKTLVADVMSLRVTPRKSWTLRFPIVPERFLSHFVRGYFDGDGSIMFNKPNVIKICFLGSEEFLQELRIRLHCSVGVKLNPIALGNIYQLYYYGEDARKICGWMYVDAEDLYLKRKKERFDKHLELRKTQWPTSKHSY